MPKDIRMLQDYTQNCLCKFLELCQKSYLMLFVLSVTNKIKSIYPRVILSGIYCFSFWFTEGKQSLKNMVLLMYTLTNPILYSMTLAGV